MSWRFLDEWGYACHTSLPHQLFEGVCAWTFLHSNRLSSCCRRGNYPHSTEPVPMPSKKAKKLNKLPREKVLLEPCRRLTNSIRAFFKTELGPKRSRAGTTPLF